MTVIRITSASSNPFVRKLHEALKARGSNPRVYRTFVQVEHGSVQLATTSKDVHLKIGTWMPDARAALCQILEGLASGESVIEFEAAAWHTVRGSGHDANMYSIAPAH